MFNFTVQNRDETISEWKCPHCNKNKFCSIVNNAVLKNDYNELLIGCYSCNELHIREYVFDRLKFSKKKTVDLSYPHKEWECPFCKNTDNGFVFIDDNILKEIYRNIRVGCNSCFEEHVLQYKYSKSFKLIRE